MLIFGSSAGAYIRHQFHEEEPGGIEIKGLLSRGISGLVATGFSLQRRDSKFVQRCFGGVNFVYGFGQDIGQMSVEAIAFVTPVPCSGASGKSQPGANFDSLEKSYIENSLTEKGVVQVSFPAAHKTTQAFLTELSISTSSVQTNIHMCRFDFMILDLSAKQNQANSNTVPNLSPAVPSDGSSSSPVGIFGPTDEEKLLANTLGSNLAEAAQGLGEKVAAAVASMGDKLGTIPAESFAPQERMTDIDSFFNVFNDLARR